MATQSSKPSGQVSSPTTPMGEESVSPVSSPSRLGGLSTSMFPEPNMKQEAIQRAQVGSLMGANGNNIEVILPAMDWLSDKGVIHSLLGDLG